MFFEEDEIEDLLSVPLMGPLAPEVGKGVDLSDEAMERLGDYLARQIEQGLDERGGVEPRWEENWRQYHASPDRFISAYFTGAADVGFPFSKPRADALQDSVVGMIFGAEPVVTASCPDEGAMQPVTKQIEKILGDAFSFNNMEELLKEQAPQAFCTNHAITRLRWEPNFAMPVAEKVLPDDFVVAGAPFMDIQAATLVGHCFKRYRRDYERMVKSGEYRECDHEPPAITSLPRQGDSAGVAMGTPAKTEDDFVELYEVVFRLDLGWFEDDDDSQLPSENRYYVATLQKDLSHICRIQEYAYTRPLYFNCSYKPQTERGFWCKQSIASDLQGPHRIYNNLLNLALYGALYSAFPTGVGEAIEGATKLEGATAKARQLMPNHVIEGVTGASPFANNFNMGAVMTMLQQVERAGDASCRINQAGIGQEFSKRMTATEASQLAAAQAAGIGGYAATFSYGILDIARGMLELMEVHQDSYLRSNGARVGVNPGIFGPEIDRVNLEITGRNPSVSPMAVIGHLQMLLAMQRPAPNEPPRINSYEVLKRLVSTLRLANGKELLIEPPMGPPVPVPGMGIPPGPMPGAPQGAPGNPLQDVLGLAAGGPGDGAMPGPDLGFGMDFGRLPGAGA